MGTRTRMTYTDFCRLPDDNLVHEIIDGVHYMNPAPVPFHQKVIGMLFTQIQGYLTEHPLGEAYFAPVDILFSDYDVVEPDLVYIAREHLDILTEKNVQGAPDLLAEVLSPGTRKKDLELKYHLYEQHGVREYWIVDPGLKTVRVLRLEQGRYREAALLGHGDTLTTPLLPGLEIPLVKVFAR